MKNIVTFKKRPSGSTGNILLSRILAILASVLLLMLVLLLALEDKNDLGKSLERIFINPFFTERGIYNTLRGTVPLVIVSLGICVAFKMKLWNIGGNGQMMMGAIFANAVSVYFPNLPGWSFIPLMIVAAIVGGAFWAAICAVPKAFLNVNETIVSLMLNYVAVSFANYLILNPWRITDGFAQPPSIPDAARLPIFGTSGVGASIFIAVALLGFYIFLMKKTRFGYEIRVTGESHGAAAYAGINVKKTIILSLLISGAMAGLGGYAILAGNEGSGQLSTQLHAGIGFTAVIVAWLSNLNPLSVIFMSVFLVGINNGSHNIQSFGLDGSLSDLAQGIVLFMVLALDVITKYEIRFFPKKEKEEP